MNIQTTVNQSQLYDVLINIAVSRPVFIWGAPGIGKSSIVEQFAAELGLPCVSLLDSQLAPEDIIGVPRISGDASEFCPPKMIARDEPYCLFLDELNACSHEVQKSFYSLIHERRIGEYHLPEDSIVIGAGNRAQDNAIVRPMSSALINRMFHVELVASHRDWLAWAKNSNIHPHVIEYIGLRPDHLWQQPPKTEEAFSSPRSWHLTTTRNFPIGLWSKSSETFRDWPLRRKTDVMGKKYNAKPRPLTENEINFLDGKAIVSNHPLFSGLLFSARLEHGTKSAYTPSEGLAVVADDGTIFCDTKKRVSSEVWARVIAHCLLHLAFGHFDEFKREGQSVWLQHKFDNEVEDFLNSIGFGEAPGYSGRGTAGNDVPDMFLLEHDRFYYMYNRHNWPAIFARGISVSLDHAVRIAAGAELPKDQGSPKSISSEAGKVRSWFISSYPLLGSVAAAFKLIEDPLVCVRMGIHTAAVSCSMREIYINPAAGLTNQELKFVMAHEFLHAALRHDVRHQWRDAYLWNVACDFVINLWLTEMRIGERPYDVLYDEDLAGLSAETVYDQLACDLRIRRKLEKLSTFAGRGKPDILPTDAAYWDSREGIDLDGFYRRALSQGLEYHGARVVFCDADAYDQGYMKPDDIAGTVQVRGRGGTELQPAIDLLDRADDFPKDAPLLIITDGYCEDRLMLYGREHAYLLPEESSLPFPPKGSVFRIQG